MLIWDKVSKTYAGKTVADNITMQVAPGTWTAVLGRSGSGKSTLLKMAAGLVQPDSGRILFDGCDITRTAPEKRGMGVMFQDYALLPHLSVAENAAFGLRMRKMPKTAARRQAGRFLDMVGLSALADASVLKLSGGEQQRVALARALAVNPKAMLLDEPFSALDSTLRPGIQELTHRLLREQNCPTVWVTHNPDEALSAADRIFLLENGRVLQEGTPAELLAKPQSASAARLLGCRNVGERLYIPQSALRYHPDRTGSYDVLAVRDTAAGREVLFRHDRYGDLTLFVPASVQIPAPGGRIFVETDAEKFVQFAL